MALRPKNHCQMCYKEWYPRGSDLADKCPRCGSSAVRILGHSHISQSPSPVASKSKPSALAGCLMLLLFIGIGIFVSKRERKDLTVQAEEQKEQPTTTNKLPSTARVDPVLKQKPSSEPVPLVRPSIVQTPVEIAPPPREYRWKIPFSVYSSAWQKFGSIDLRIAGLSITSVPLIDSKAHVTESDYQLLAIFVEVRKNTPDKKRTLLSWTASGFYYGRIFDGASNELPPGKLPTGRKLYAGIPFAQPLPDDGTPVYDILLFIKPEENRGQLDLRLDAERCGESGDIWFTIPPEAWRKKLDEIQKK